MTYKIPCCDAEAQIVETKYLKLKEENAKITRLLCAFCAVTAKLDSWEEMYLFSDELKKWWEDHEGLVDEHEKEVFRQHEMIRVSRAIAELTSELKDLQRRGPLRYG